MHILAVDDDPIILELLCDPALLGAAHTVTCAVDAATALKAIAQQDIPFDVLLLDVFMPGTNGIDLCAKLRKMPDYAQVPIIIMTGSCQIDLIQRAYNAGATDFVKKPLEGLELLTRVMMAEELTTARRDANAARATAKTLSRLIADPFAHHPPQAAKTGRLRYMELENRLLTAPQGCHALHLFHIMVPTAATAPAPQRAERFAENLDHVFDTALSATDHKMDLAYAGHGVFVGVTYGRRRETMSALQINIVTALQKAGHAHLAEGLTCGSISRTTVWTSRTAVAAVRHFVNRHASCDAGSDLMDESLFDKGMADA
ncbi:response regulator [Loktanella sp. SALINAS62]|uniref:response regulator n=1 Tax=Loktanella sp. SALINAS62 TaxID=2706124 RepID=UPI001B8B3EEF|nr:response regulator [Loktanella sp. SALINAS62]MBS1301279.1 response regulator [Loktanella sp. SALINAS62]